MECFSIIFVKFNLKILNRKGEESSNKYLMYHKSLYDLDGKESAIGNGKGIPDLVKLLFNQPRFFYRDLTREVRSR